MHFFMFGISCCTFNFFFNATGTILINVVDITDFYRAFWSTCWHTIWFLRLLLRLCSPDIISVHVFPRVYEDLPFPLCGFNKLKTGFLSVIYHGVLYETSKYRLLVVVRRPSSWDYCGSIARHPPPESKLQYTCSSAAFLTIFFLVNYNTVRLHVFLWKVILKRVHCVEKKQIK